MEITETLTKQITETSYLTTENTQRYRPILRYFYEQYEKINYMLYKEDVWNYLKDKTNFENYTIETCENDLTALVNWGNLSALQDTNNVSTVEEFKHRKFRYQLTEYAVEIERLVIKLENLHIEGASLEPKLIERIKEEIERFKQTGFEEEEFLRIKKKLYGEYVKEYNDISVIANNLLGDYMKDLTPFIYFEEFDTLTKSEVEEILKEVLVEEKSVTSIIKPLN